MNSKQSQAEKLFRLHELEQLIGMSKSSIYSAMKNSQFPKPIKLGARAVAWPESTIAEWISSRRGA